MTDRPVRREIGDYVHRQNAISRLRKSGLIFPKVTKVPEEFIDKDGNLIIPDDVSLIPTEELGRYLSVFTALASFYDAVVASADVDYTTAARVVDFIEAKVLLEVDGGTLAEKKARRDLDGTVIKSQDWKDSQEASFKLSKALLTGIERILFMLSREITRRGARSSFEDGGPSPRQPRHYE